METEILAGRYGSYELVFASEEAREAYFELCLDSISANEMHEAWQLYHLSVRDVLERVFESVRQGTSEAYFLLYHNEYEEKTEVVGIGGMADLPELAGLTALPECADLGEKAGEIWFMGENLASHKRFLVQYGRKIAAKALTKYSALLNIAAVWNTAAFRLVKFLGFTVGEKAICAGMENALFKYFYLIRK